MNTTLLNANRKTSIAPSLVGVILIFTAVLIIIYIVRSAQNSYSSTNTVEDAAQHATSSFNTKVSNSIKNASLPSYDAYSQPKESVEPAVISVFDNQNMAKGVTLVEAPIITVAPIIDLSWATQDWLAIARAADGSRWVYGDAWFNCAYIEQESLAYLADTTNPALHIWNKLAPRMQNNLMKACKL